MSAAATPARSAKWLLRQPTLAVLPKLAILPLAGDPSVTRINVVPRDFVIDAVGYLSGQPQSSGRTYQLADPHPPTVAEMVDTLAYATGRKVIKVGLPREVAKGVLAHVPGAYRLLRIPPGRRSTITPTPPITSPTTRKPISRAAGSTFPPSTATSTASSSSCSTTPRSDPQRWPKRARRNAPSRGLRRAGREDAEPRPALSARIFPVAAGSPSEGLPRRLDH
jgi:hypothetical protein